MTVMRGNPVTPAGTPTLWTMVRAQADKFRRDIQADILKAIEVTRVAHSHTG